MTQIPILPEDARISTVWQRAEPGMYDVDISGTNAGLDSLIALLDSLDAPGQRVVLEIGAAPLDEASHAGLVLLLVDDVAVPAACDGILPFGDATAGRITLAVTTAGRELLRRILSDVRDAAPGDDAMEYHVHPAGGSNIDLAFRQRPLAWFNDIGPHTEEPAAVDFYVFDPEADDLDRRPMVAVTGTYAGLGLLAVGTVEPNPPPPAS